jgi:hypothetical protein
MKRLEPSEGSVFVNLKSQIQNQKLVQAGLPCQMEQDAIFAPKLRGFER